MLSEEHKKELSSIYDSVNSTNSLVTLDNLLRRATEIAKLYRQENGRSIMANRLNHLRNKYFNPANGERQKGNREQLISDLKTNFRADLLPYLEH
jgi:hypothetical protein